MKLENKKKENLYLLSILAVILLLVNLYSVNKYVIYNKVLDDAKYITYVYLNKKKHSGGKGSYYIMQVEYRDKIYNVSLTKSMFNEIENGFLPKLFHTPEDEIITNWNLIIVKRVLIVTIVGFFISTSILLLLLFKKDKKDKKR